MNNDELESKGFRMPSGEELEARWKQIEDWPNTVWFYLEINTTSRVLMQFGTCEIIGIFPA